MKKICLFLFIVFFCFGWTFAQTQYSCNNLYTIKLPSNLELQSSELNTVERIVQGKSTQTKISTLSNGIIFQQKGLNADEKSAYSKYCRVIIEYFKEGRNDPVYGRGDQIYVDKEIIDIVHESVKETCDASKTPLMKLFTIQPLTINGFPVLYYSYRRKGWEGKNPPVIVNVYMIYNRYEKVKLTFSYREAEREIWKEAHEYIMKSFSFTKKY